jgi:hypothetical protein
MAGRIQVKLPSCGTDEMPCRGWQFVFQDDSPAPQCHFANQFNAGNRPGVVVASLATLEVRQGAQEWEPLHGGCAASERVRHRRPVHSTSEAVTVHYDL